MCGRVPHGDSSSFLAGMHSETYRIEKLRVAISLRLRGGAAIDGCIFLQSWAYHRSGPEEPLDLLNAPEPFIPVQVASGETRLVAKAHILALQPTEPAGVDELRLATARPAEVALSLVDGSTHHGTVFIEMPQSRPRVLDFLNGDGSPFFALHADDRVTLINRQAIAYAQPRD